MHRSSTFLPQLFHNIAPGSLSLVRILLTYAVFVAGVTAHAQTIDPHAVYRVFLSDGRALPSYGEYTALPDRLAFVLIVGDPRAKHDQQLVSLPLSAINLARTQRYAEMIRAQQYAATRGPGDYSALTANLDLTLAELAKPGPAGPRLQMADEARQRLVDWPSAHHYYRAADVRKLIESLDQVIAEARPTRYAPPRVPDPPVFEPELPLPGLRDSLTLSLAAASASRDADQRNVVLRAALDVASGDPALTDLRDQISQQLGLSAPAPVTATVRPAPPAGRPSPPVVSAPAAPRTPPPAAPAVSVAPLAKAPKTEPKTEAKTAPKTEPKTEPKKEPPAPKTAAPEHVPVQAPATAPATPVAAPHAAPTYTAPAKPVAPVTAPAAAPVPAPAATPTIAPVVRANSTDRGRFSLVLVIAGIAVLALVMVVAQRRRRSTPRPEESRPDVPVLAPPALPSPPALSVPARPVAAPVAEPPVLPPDDASPIGNPSLEVIGVNDSSRYGFHTVEGEVKNISEGVLHDVEVVVQWYVSSGRLLTSDVALLETTALPAGRTSAFKVLTRSSPAMASYSLVFKAGREVIARFQPSISR